MKTENDFNAYLGKNLRTLIPEVKVIKVSDRFTEAISDFLVWYKGKSLAFEVKFEKDYPKRDTSKVLSHPFKKSQITFLKEILITGSYAWGFVAMDCDKMMYIFDPAIIPENGNMSKEYFKKSYLKRFHYSEYKEALDYMIGENIYV